MSKGKPLPIVTLSKTEAEAALAASSQKRRKKEEEHTSDKKTKIRPSASCRMTKARFDRLNKVSEGFLKASPAPAAASKGHKIQSGSALLLRLCRDFCTGGGKGKEHLKLLDDWPHGNDEAIMRLCTEVAAGGSGGKGAAKAFAQHLIKCKAVGVVVGAAAQLLQSFSAASALQALQHKKAGTDCTPGLGRRYCLQYIWLVLHNAKQAQASGKGIDEQALVDEFEAVVVKVMSHAIHKFKQPVTVPEYKALFEIALDDVISPSAVEKGRDLEPFGRRIARAAIIGTLSQLMESSALETRLLFMKSMNVVLLRRVDENASAVLEHRWGWGVMGEGEGGRVMGEDLGGWGEGGQG